ncbi:DNA cytosine methyltransferase [Paracerasibacillus soli]|uniref:DNA cytosine methyltransferase n=1 Tax=Paracerasibacillus soli TaxID=480284 RepID=A0ABU5CPE2_9BACI|nr:DNA cytosine methyltransferase [Virgibacillus soli]MDY0407333.1 DNA cytosine methyltransferase [Virgibacillus soli]
MLGDNYSISWRVLDAQYWGVPQRRKRIFLVADFNGRSASEMFLSQRACEGILRRAKKRGKELPEILQKVLEKQAISA